jgi:hypothetical protein
MSIAANAPWSFHKLQRSGMFLRRFIERPRFFCGQIGLAHTRWRIHGFSV